MKGWIALDIDGTITNDKYSVPDVVVDYLRKIQKEGWNIVLSTGRAFSFASLALEKMDFPFTIFSQNGSIAIEMPSREILFKKYLNRSMISEIERVYEKREDDFIVYSGFERGDFCYFRPKKCSPESSKYLEQIQIREKKKWEEVDFFPEGLESPLVKCFGRIDKMRSLAKILGKTGLFELSLIRDPFYPPYHILMVTEKNASKGSAITEMVQRFGRGKLVIAAGDDENDISMLKSADVRIAMPHAPESVRKNAHFIAPPVEEFGIVQALKIVTKKIK